MAAPLHLAGVGEGASRREALVADNEFEAGGQEEVEAEVGGDDERRGGLLAGKIIVDGIGERIDERRALLL